MQQQVQTREPNYFGSLITSANPSRATLIAVHRERYRVHAQASLEKVEGRDVREIYYQDDCGWSWHPVEFGYIKRIETALGFDTKSPQDSRRTLCALLSSNESTPELEAALNDFVTWLTGKAS